MHCLFSFLNILKKWILLLRLAQWIKGQCHLQACEYASANAVFSHLQEASVLKDDVTNLLSQGTTLFLAGDFTHALLPLQRVNY